MFRLFRFTRTLILLILVALIAGAAACAVNAGRMLIEPAALQMPAPADAIVVLAGSEADRWLEAYELWREGIAPVIALSPGFQDPGSLELARRGIDMPTSMDIGRDLMISRMGVPERSVIMLPGPVDNTAAESEHTRRLAAAHGWRRVIVVTSVPHTRRTALAMRRVLNPAGIDVQVRGSRFDRFQPARWWQSRSSVRWVLTEWPKLLAYRLGVGE